MIILSHRGLWKNQEEKNSLVAFKRSFDLGFGTETDIRDFGGELVISHDIPQPGCIPAEQLFLTHREYDRQLPLALNIKSDGLQQKLKQLIDKYDVRNYFVFDMSVPDALGYVSQGISTFTRQSEYEEVPSFYHLAEGVWIDEFDYHWVDERILAEHVRNEKKICIVSPDLHKREYVTEWKHYKIIEDSLPIESLMICTDYPEDARGYFNDH